MRPLRGLSWRGTAYLSSVIITGAVLLPLAFVLFPVRRGDTVASLVYLGLFTQLAAMMPIKWRHGVQTVDNMPLVAASLFAPGLGPILLGWLCKNDGRWPTSERPLSRLLFNRARSAIEFGVPSMAIAALPLPSELDIPLKTLCLAFGNLLIGYPLSGMAIAAYERERFWKVLGANVGLSSIRSVLILSIGGGALYMVLQLPGGYVMGFGLLGLLFAVRSNMADAQRQHVERIQTLELMAQALDARDPMTESHSQRVSNLAAQIAQALGMSNLEIERIRVAGLLHDIGKIGVPDSVLKKPSALDPGEWAAMRRHAEVGAEMIARHSALQPIAPWVRHHHERWNGSGYPAGLTETEIPLGARILAVADSFDTITGPRVYRKTSMTPLEAVADISATSSILYDPVVVNALRQLHGVPPLQHSEAPEQDQGPSALDLLRTNARLRALGAGMTISNLGDPLTAVAVTVTAYTITHSGLAVGIALALRAAAMMAAGALLGGAADRLKRRQLIVCADLVQFGVLAATPALLLIAPYSLFGVMVLLGAAAALGQAGREASLTEVVQPGQIATANGLVSTGVKTATSIGYPVAAVLIWIGSGTGTLFLVDAATFAVAASLTLLAGPLGGGIPSSRITGALRSSLAVRSVRKPLVIAGLGAFSLSMTTPALIVIANGFHGNGPRIYTLLEVVLTAGMLAGAVAFAALSGSARHAVVAGLVLMGALSVGIAASNAVLLTAAFLFIASIGNQLYFIGNRTELQQAAPHDRVGSVMATRGALVQAAAVAGAAAGGMLSTSLGGQQTYGVAGLLLLVLAVVAVTRLRTKPLAGRRVSGVEAVKTA